VVKKKDTFDVKQHNINLLKNLSCQVNEVDSTNQIFV